MKIAEGLDILELGSKERRMNATLIWDDKNVILIDTGLPGQIENIREEVEKAGVSFDKINKIIITHHDLDHIGSLSSIVKNSKSEIEVLAHSGERPYIEGEKIGIKITPERLSSMPESMKETIKQLKTKVNRVVKDEEELSYCGGIEVIYTPGHTPGHICLYLKKYKALVTGDAMNVVNDELIGPNPEYTFDMKQAIESLKKLTKYDIETVICYHGGVFTKSSNDRIAKLANS
ncbi:MBL fold metallo-hydrolase [Clostridium beijerinckii]|uniref:MBL fold metallo-hydrolase n=1 Tax=Clostridium beijerinckii TaxID=1520 RepID=UPI000479966A|nr:MBL fold metallo-hydrolase [Clostridium beijerinckii]